MHFHGLFQQFFVSVKTIKNTYVFRIIKLNICILIEKKTLGLPKDSNGIIYATSDGITLVILF